MSMYTLGIDTTFHTTGLALVDEANRVKFNKSLPIDFSNQDADKFFSAHIKNLVVLLPLIENFWDKINLISVVNKEGAFHSVPVGVTAACILGSVRNKAVVGVDHEIAHLYSNWLERQDENFEFPIVSLSVSGAHTAVYCLESHDKIKKLISIIWGESGDSFQGIAALFDGFCRLMGISMPTVGSGGLVLSKLAQKGHVVNFPEFHHIQKTYDGENVVIAGLEKTTEEIRARHKKDIFKKEFQENLALNFFNYIFSTLGGELVKFAEALGSKEMHLVGGVSANLLFQDMIHRFAAERGVIFRSPAKSEFCGDNAAMVAVRGKHKRPFSENQNFLPVYPSLWYYKYFCKKYLRGDEKV